MYEIKFAFNKQKHYTSQFTTLFHCLNCKYKNPMMCKMNFCKGCLSLHFNRSEYKSVFCV